MDIMHTMIFACVHVVYNEQNIIEQTHIINKSRWTCDDY